MALCLLAIGPAAHRSLMAPLAGGEDGHKLSAACNKKFSEALLRESDRLVTPKSRASSILLESCARSGVGNFFSDGPHDRPASSGRATEVLLKGRCGGVLVGNCANIPASFR